MPHLRLIASLTHAFLTSLNSSSCLMVSELVNLTNFFFSFSPSQHLNFKSTALFFFLTLTASRSRSCPLCSTLCFSTSSGIDSFLLILILITWFSFFHLIIFWFFFFFFISLGFISESLFMCLTLSQVLHSVTSLLSGNFYQLLVYNSILVYLWFCVCCGFDLQSIIVAKYSLQSIILLFVYVVLMNLFVDKMVVVIVLMNLFVDKMVVVIVLMNLFVNKMVSL